ncbi:MAG TPA: hypothetical protein VFZ65_07655 [Planctomycetota bacterium]|nr:hypothetical protein [Planctomycetota bacterium]
MRLIPLTLGILFLQAPAKADKFWLADPANQKTAVEGSSPDYIEGVLIAESDEGYHIRVVGGEVLLPKASVFKIEKNALSIDDIVKAEQEAAKANEAANREREMANAAAQRKQQIRAVEASAPRRSEGSVAPAAQPFDPVIGVVPNPEAMSDEMLQREVSLAFELTRDRRYLKMLRQLRRLR